MATATLLHEEHIAHRMSLLHVAALRDDVQMLELVLSHGAGIHLNARLAAGNEGRYAGQTPLQVAAKARNENAAKTLIAHGAGYDVFSAACLDDKTRVASSLSADPGVLRELDAYGGSVLHWAVESVQAEIVSLLLDCGADIDAQNALGETPLLLASTHDAHGTDRRSLVSLLIARGARIDAHAAAATGDLDQLKEIHARNPLSIQRKSSHGWTALHWAARNGNLEVARKLMDWGCEVNAADAIGWTPLFPAAYWGQRAEIVRLLAEHGADLNHRDRFNHPVTDYDTGVAVGEVLRQLR